MHPSVPVRSHKSTFSISTSPCHRPCPFSLPFTFVRRRPLTSATIRVTAAHSVRRCNRNELLPFSRFVRFFTLVGVAREADGQRSDWGARIKDGKHERISSDDPASCPATKAAFPNLLSSRQTVQGCSSGPNWHSVEAVP